MIFQKLDIIPSIFVISMYIYKLKCGARGCDAKLRINFACATLTSVANTKAHSRARLNYASLTGWLVPWLVPASFFYNNISCSLDSTMAKWLAHLPFTSKVAGSRLSENFSMWLEPSPHVERVKKSTLCRKSWVFSGYSGFLPQGKLTGWVRHMGQEADH
jgi:hypothetical protein